MIEYLMTGRKRIQFLISVPKPILLCQVEPVESQDYSGEAEKKFCPATRQTPADKTFNLQNTQENILLLSDLSIIISNFIL